MNFYEKVGKTQQQLQNIIFDDYHGERLRLKLLHFFRAYTLAGEHMAKNGERQLASS